MQILIGRFQKLQNMALIRSCIFEYLKFCNYFVTKLPNLINTSPPGDQITYGLWKTLTMLISIFIWLLDKETKKKLCKDLFLLFTYKCTSQGVRHRLLVSQNRLTSIIKPLNQWGRFQNISNVAQKKRWILGYLNFCNY